MQEYREAGIGVQLRRLILRMVLTWGKIPKGQAWSKFRGAGRELDRQNSGGEGWPREQRKSSKVRVQGREKAEV